MTATETPDATLPSTCRYHPVLIAAAIAGATAILIGAFGAHWLKPHLIESGMPTERVSERLAQFDTGARYHLAHAVVLLALAAVPVERNRTWRFVIGLTIGGIVLFSGSLYLLVLTDTPRWGAVTPLGGSCWIVGWFLVLFLKPLANTMARSSK